MRNISFSKTIEQVRDRQKTVTRRTGWRWLKEGTLLRPVEKAMGLKKGERIQPIFDDGTCIRVVDVGIECLSAIQHQHDEPAREGFPDMSTIEFIEFFKREMGARLDTVLTVIEFEYVEGDQ